MTSKRADIAMPATPSASGRFGFARAADGDVLFDETGAHAVVTCAVEEAGGYWADPGHGSTLMQVRQLSTATPSQAESAVRQGLQPLSRDGTVAGAPVVSARVERAVGAGRLRVDVSWTTPGGGRESRRLPVD